MNPETKEINAFIKTFDMSHYKSGELPFEYIQAEISTLCNSPMVLIRLKIGKSEDEKVEHGVRLDLDKRAFLDWPLKEGLGAPENIRKLLAIEAKDISKFLAPQIIAAKDNSAFCTL